MFVVSVPNALNGTRVSAKKHPGGLHRYQAIRIGQRTARSALDALDERVRVTRPEESHAAPPSV